ncbi:putative GPI-anchored protein pfl2 [Lytechinus variegatus]|uniref:putative GPI-anchored protein pfl2 n=1 Tax=Lytechinus variegatus TaxID=7654 RepID=UPI001BB2B183|nr:putative GPI-anchored protein pfl2 [Lytechinus variegatus]
MGVLDKFLFFTCLVLYSQRVINASSNCRTEPFECREEQCEATNSIAYNGSNYEWEDVNTDTNIRGDDLCKLLCRTTGLPVNFNDDRPGDFADGTQCWDWDESDIKSTKRCMGGQCQNFGCDNVLNSGQLYDACHVCGGDGSSCTCFPKINYSPTITRFMLSELARIPAGATNLIFTNNGPGINNLGLSSGGRNIINSFLRIYGRYTAFNMTFEYFQVYNASTIRLLTEPTTAPLELKIFKFSLPSVNLTINYCLPKPELSSSVLTIASTITSSSSSALSAQSSVSPSVMLTSLPSVTLASSELSSSVPKIASSTVPSSSSSALSAQSSVTPSPSVMLTSLPSVTLASSELSSSVPNIASSTVPSSSSSALSAQSSVTPSVMLTSLPSVTLASSELSSSVPKIASSTVPSSSSSALSAQSSVTPSPSVMLTSLPSVNLASSELSSSVPKIASSTVPSSSSSALSAQSSVTPSPSVMLTSLPSVTLASSELSSSVPKMASSKVPSSSSSALSAQSSVTPSPSVMLTSLPSVTFASSELSSRVPTIASTITSTSSSALIALSSEAPSTMQSSSTLLASNSSISLSMVGTTSFFPVMTASSLLQSSMSSPPLTMMSSPTLLSTSSLVTTSLLGTTSSSVMAQTSIFSSTVANIRPTPSMVQSKSAVDMPGTHTATPSVREEMTMSTATPIQPEKTVGASQQLSGSAIFGIVFTVLFVCILIATIAILCVVNFKMRRTMKRNAESTTQLTRL